jgi:transcription elongation factor GreA
MKDRTHYLTPEGLEKVNRELEYLSTVKRSEIAERLGFAIQQGDISENADYEVAKQEQAFNEGKIKDLEAVLRHARIIESDIPTDEVRVGNRVTVVEEGFPPETYTIVGPTEAAPEKGRISHESPVGSALLGKRVGDTIAIKTPAGELALTVSAIG